MEYSIKEMSEKTGLSIPTLRFYDKEGLFPNLERKSSNYLLLLILSLML